MLQSTIFYQLVKTPIDIKFAPRLATHTEKDSTISLLFESNPHLQNVNLIIDKVCENENETCPQINLKEGRGNDELFVSNITQVLNILYSFSLMVILGIK